MYLIGPAVGVYLVTFFALAILLPTTALLAITKWRREFNIIKTCAPFVACVGFLIGTRIIFPLRDASGDWFTMKQWISRFYH